MDYYKNGFKMHVHPKFDEMYSRLVDAANACDEWLDDYEKPSKEARAIEKAIDEAMGRCLVFEELVARAWEER